ncbi:MAG: hypothetical protein DMF55_00380 [Acidobacteria bacterium]|nr:MAG: hypothetical protein DMF55_00380 [Acidobacteriota bacterium]
MLAELPMRPIGPVGPLVLVTTGGKLPAQEPPPQPGIRLPAQAPAWQASASVQELPSLHGVPFGLAGLEQRPEVVSQVPATWH